MRVFIDVSGGCVPYWRAGQKGREFLNWLARYAEGYFATFAAEIREGGAFGPDSNKIDFPLDGGGTDVNCLGADHLEVGEELKILLTDGCHEPIKFIPRNMITIHPATLNNPKFLALHLSFLDDELKKMEANVFTT